MKKNTLWWIIGLYALFLFGVFIAFYNTGTAVDKHLADQLLLYIALAKGKSIFTTSEITQHLITNVWVLEQFLPVKFEIDGKLGTPGRVSVDGTERAVIW